MKGLLEISVYNKDLENAGLSPEDFMKFVTKVVATQVSSAVNGIISAGFDPNIISDEDPPPLRVKTPKEWN